jgi:transcriptional regulator with XRE-family HTH domain
MPRRSIPDPLAAAVGLRIRRLREELGLTMEKLAYESELGSKGHLSNIERGLARPTIRTLKVLADRLGVKLLDMVTFPDEDARQRLVDRSRDMQRGPIRKLLAQFGEPTRRRKASGKSADQDAAPAGKAKAKAKGPAAAKGGAQAKAAAPAKKARASKAAAAASRRGPHPT